MFETALEDDEMITAVSFPKTAKAAYVKFRTRPRAMPWSACSSPAAAAARGLPLPAQAVTAYSARRHGIGPRRQLSPDSLDGIGVDADDMISDIHDPATIARILYAKSPSARGSLLNRHLPNMTKGGVFPPFFVRCPSWSGRRGSNPRPRAWEARALPTELHPHRSD